LKRFPAYETAVGDENPPYDYVKRMIDNIMVPINVPKIGFVATIIT